MHLNLADAEHEAAHLVVGLALGLKLRRAFVRRETWNGLTIDGLVYFNGYQRRRLAIGVMACAGIVWEAKLGRKGLDWVDAKLARTCLTSTHDVLVATRLAREILEGRRRLHARVASELCDRDLGPADVEALVLEHA